MNDEDEVVQVTKMTGFLIHRARGRESALETSPQGEEVNSETGAVAADHNKTPIEVKCHSHWKLIHHQYSRIVLCDVVDSGACLVEPGRPPA